MHHEFLKGATQVSVCQTVFGVQLTFSFDTVWAQPVVLSLQHYSFGLYSIRFNDDFQALPFIRMCLHLPRRRKIHNITEPQITDSKRTIKVHVRVIFNSQSSVKRTDQCPVLHSLWFPSLMSALEQTLSSFVLHVQTEIQDLGTNMEQKEMVQGLNNIHSDNKQEEQSACNKSLNTVHV